MLARLRREPGDTASRKGGVEMKVRTVLLLLLVFAVISTIVPIAFAKMRIKQFRILAGDTTNPQTISFLTTYGFTPTGLVVVAPDGGAMLKFKGMGGRANFWERLEPGMSFEIKPSINYPVDSLTVLRDATSSSCHATAYGGE